MPRFVIESLTFKGTRVMVWQVLELLEVGVSAAEIYAAFPTLPEGAIETALHYATERAKGVNYVPFEKDFSQAQIFAFGKGSRS